MDTPWRVGIEWEWGGGDGGYSLPEWFPEVGGGRGERMALVEGRERGHHSVGGVCRGWRCRPSEMGGRRDAPTVAGVGDGE